MRIPGHQRKSYAWRWTAALAALAVLSVALVMALVVAPAQRVQGASATYTVDNVGDATGGACSTTASDCSLRSAIEKANANSGYANTISFSVGISTITPGSAYDAIIDNGLTINGGGQTIGGGFATLEVNANNVTINHLILDGGGAAANGVMVDPNRGYTHLTNVEVRNYTGSGILAVGNNDSLVLDTVHVHDNISVGISIGTGSDGSIIRTSHVEDNQSSGILFLGAGSDNQILNNTIDDNGVAPLNTGIGATSQSDLTISGNTISNNFDKQIRIVGGGTGVVTIKNNSIESVGLDGIDLDTTCSCGNVVISGSTDAEANCFSGNPGAGQYYLVNKSGESVNAMFNYWAGDIDPTDKICAANQTLTCVPGAGSNVDWAPVAPSCTGAAATPTPTPIAATATAAAAATATAAAAATATAAAATSTPTATATATPLPAAATATAAAAATATAAAGAMESVPLVAGCNPVASTYPDATPITTIANAVSPSGVLISIWKFDTATSMWRGYSPLFPQASDLASVDRLDAIFICVSSAATWLRNLI